jgi:hypothetical protein
MTYLSRRNVLAAGAVNGAIAALRLSPARAAGPPQPALPIPPEVRANAQGEIRIRPIADLCCEALKDARAKTRGQWREVYR